MTTIDEFRELAFDAWMQFAYHPNDATPEVRMDGGLSTLEWLAEVLVREGVLVRVAERPEMEWYRPSDPRLYPPCP